MQASKSIRVIVCTMVMCAAVTSQNAHAQAASVPGPDLYANASLLAERRRARWHLETATADAGGMSKQDNNPESIQLAAGA
jgi:hypothetical protein